MTNALDKYFQDFKNTIADQIETNRNLIFDGLVNNISNYTNAIPESLFVNYFLPYFTQQVISNTWVLDWISIAGTPMAPVRVYKDGTNELLFIVPGLLDTNTLSLVNENNNISIANMLSTYEQHNNNIPIKGVKFLIDALKDKSNALLCTNNLNEASKTWLTILTRYNLINTNQVNNQNKGNDDLSNYLE